MADLSHASSEFVALLGQGLKAYDEGDVERARAIFGEALEIEPNNVWALLWRGATAATPTESRLWLEQALTVDPANAHAIAGLEWVERVEPEYLQSVQGERAAAAGETGEEEASVVAATAQEVVSEAGLEPELEVTEPPEDVEDETVALPDRLAAHEGGAQPSEEALHAGEIPQAEHQGEQSREATGVEEQDVTDATQDEATGAIPEWLGTAAGLVAEAASGVSTWLREATDDTEKELSDTQVRETPQEETALGEQSPQESPAWLSDEVEADESEETSPEWQQAEVTTPDELPDWLRVGEESAANPGEQELPYWLQFQEFEGEAGDDEEIELPDWLRGDVDALDSLGTDDLPDWLLEETESDTIIEAEAVGLPDWLLDEGVTEEESPASGTTATLDVDEIYQRGLHAYEEDRLGDAIAAFEEVIRLMPEHVEAHNYLGSVFFLAERPDDAIRALRRAVELDPDYTESYLNLGLVYKESGHRDDAIEMFQRYLELAPENNDGTASYVQELLDDLRR